MSRFFFHVVRPDAYEHDPEGSEFETSEAAYLAACQGVLEIGLEALRTGRDARGWRYEVCDARGRLVFDLPFEDVLRARKALAPASAEPIRESLHEELRRSRRLGADLVDAL